MFDAVIDAPAWVQMWTIGVVVYFAIKIATVFRVDGWTAVRFGSYLFATPTLDPRPFVGERSQQRADSRSGLFGVTGVFAGALVWLLLVPAARLSSDWLAGLLVMVGVVCTLHFGVFEFITAAWRTHGIATRSIMDRPLQSQSLSEFWGRHWNTAFRDAATLLVVHPLRKRLSTTALLLAVFLVSGLAHDLVMSLPAGGWGLPTLYFLLQAIGQLLGRSKLAMRLGVSDGRTGMLWTAAWLLIPLPLLAHRPFCEQIMLPFYDACVAAALPGVITTDDMSPDAGRARLVQLGGFLQLSILLASAATPFLLDWRTALAPLPLLLRQLFWVYGGYIVLTIVALGFCSLGFSAEVSGSSSLGIAICLFTAIFWSVRLAIGFIGFDAEPYLTSDLKRVGYAVLTIMFAIVASLYGLIAMAALLG